MTKSRHGKDERSSSVTLRTGGNIVHVRKTISNHIIDKLILITNTSTLPSIDSFSLNSHSFLDRQYWYEMKCSISTMIEKIIPRFSFTIPTFTSTETFSNSSLNEACFSCPMEWYCLVQDSNDNILITSDNHIWLNLERGRMERSGLVTTKQDHKTNRWLYDCPLNKFKSSIDKIYYWNIVFFGDIDPLGKDCQDIFNKVNKKNDDLLSFCKRLNHEIEINSISLNPLIFKDSIDKMDKKKNINDMNSKNNSNENDNHANILEEIGIAINTCSNFNNSNSSTTRVSNDPNSYTMITIKGNLSPLIIYDLMDKWDSSILIGNGSPWVPISGNEWLKANHQYNLNFEHGYIFIKQKQQQPSQSSSLSLHSNHHGYNIYQIKSL